LGYLIAGNQLDPFNGHSPLHGEWIDGFSVNDGNPEGAKMLPNVLSYLKRNGLKIQVTTAGTNPDILEALLEQKLCDHVLMKVMGPAGTYEQLNGQVLDEETLKKSIRLTASAPEYGFSTVIAPITRKDGTVEFLTPIGDRRNSADHRNGDRQQETPLCSPTLRSKPEFG
jgi:pyruvate formate lyase activating enzyme